MGSLRRWMREVSIGHGPLCLMGNSIRNVFKFRCVHILMMMNVYIQSGRYTNKSGRLRCNLSIAKHVVS